MATSRSCERRITAVLGRFFPFWTSVFLAVLLAAPAFGDSYLLALEENLNGGKSPLPLPTKEGVYDSLFESGHVVFDTKDGSALPPIGELLELAQDGGARLLLRVRATSLDSTTPEKTRTVTTTASYELYESRTGRILGQGEITDSNSGREAQCDGRQLGMEIGRKIVKDANALVVSGRSR